MSALDRVDPLYLKPGMKLRGVVVAFNDIGTGE
jgi:hypothetical protein